MSTNVAPASRTPWHLWAVAILSLLWNGSGAYTILMAQAGRLTDMDAAETAFYTGQPWWLMIATSIATLLPVAAALALLARRRAALWLFAAALLLLIVNNGYNLAAGTSLALADPGWRVVTAVIALIAVLQLVYAWAMSRRGVLR